MDRPFFHYLFVYNIAMEIAVVLSAHENSPTYRDTLESVRRHLSDDVVVLVDGFGWKQFESESVDKIEGFRHGKSSAPVRNMALGMMGAWDRWGGSADWYCYMEYDCLVGSGDVKDHLKMADERGYWMLGNDMRRVDRSMPMLNKLAGSKVDLHYLEGSQNVSHPIQYRLGNNEKGNKLLF